MSELDKQYYDGTKLLSMTKDLDGDNPDIYMCVGNRTGGKTYFFSRLCVRRFLNGKGQFILLYRYGYQIADIGNAFFSDIQDEFPGLIMSGKSIDKGNIQELHLGKNGNDKDPVCGYALALNDADNIRRYRPLFKDCTIMYFDEFQSETGRYCPREITLFQSVHTTCCGRRRLPVIMSSNAVTMLNPYFVSMDIGYRLQKDTKFLKGKGWVLESAFVESAASDLKQSGFAKAFASDKYMDYATQNTYLNDNNNFIEKLKGDYTYLLTLHFNGEDFCIRKGDDFLYISDNVDPNFPLKVSVTVTDHGPDAILPPRSWDTLHTCKRFFELGKVYFKDLKCKQAFFNFVGISTI